MFDASRSDKQRTKTRAQRQEHKDKNRKPQIHLVHAVQPFGGNICQRRVGSEGGYRLWASSTIRVVQGGGSGFKSAVLPASIFWKKCDVIRVTWLTRPCGLFTLWIRCQRVFMFSSFLPAALKISRFHYTNDLITLFGMVKKREIGEYQWLVRTCAYFRTLIDSSQRKQ